MVLRQNKGKRPQITFTSDFHELVQGDLVEGRCVLRYDPLRLLPATDRGGAHQIEAHVRFHPGGTEWHQLLSVPAATPLATLADPTGQGFMLETDFAIPPGANELEVWFSCRHPDGQVDWDSDFGHNHWLRFPLHDLDLTKGEVVKGRTGAAGDALAVAVTSVLDIDGVDVRWRVTSAPGSTRDRAPLRLASADARSKNWETAGVVVPRGATVVFDLVYRVGLREYADDNQGRWYLAD
jgi:hypothetical protein